MAKSWLIGVTIGKTCFSFTSTYTIFNSFIMVHLHNLSIFLNYNFLYQLYLFKRMLIFIANIATVLKRMLQVIFFETINKLENFYLWKPSHHTCTYLLNSSGTGTTDLGFEDGPLSYPCAAPDKSDIVVMKVDDVMPRGWKISDVTRLSHWPLPSLSDK